MTRAASRLHASPGSRPLAPLAAAALLCAALGLAVVGTLGRRAGERWLSPAAPELASLPSRPAALGIPARAPAVPEDARDSAGHPTQAFDLPAPERRTEREHLRLFRALPREALVARAESVLTGTGSLAEKLALLRALREVDADRAAAWEETLVRSESARASRAAHEADLASTALAFLLQDAPRAAPARAALARLAFDAPLPDLALRRRAAAGFAQHCDEAGLAALDLLLLRQRDALLAEGVLAAVGDRAPSAARTRILLAHGRTELIPESLAER